MIKNKAHNSPRKTYNNTEGRIITTMPACIALMAAAHAAVTMVATTNKAPCRWPRQLVNSNNDNIKKATVSFYSLHILVIGNT